MQPLKFTLISLIIPLLFSCKKSNDIQINTVKGNITLDIHAVHHSWDVNNIKIYLKTNATVYPGPDSSLYDKYLVTDGYGKVSFTELIPGNYYVYATGFDTVWGAKVIGYKQIPLTKENLVNNEMSVTLYVSE